MAYSFPVFRRGMVFKTDRLVTSDEAKKIAACIKKEQEHYNAAFKTAIAPNGSTIVWGERSPARKTRKPQRLRRYLKESYILNFPLITFRYNGFSVEARNSVTVCRHQHRSKIWTRLSCARFGKDKTDLDQAEVQKFFKFAAANAPRILAALSKIYMKHVKQAGVSIPKSGAYFLQVRAFNSTSETSRELLSKLQNGLGVTEALNDARFRPALVDYFTIALGKKTNLIEIKKSLKERGIDIFGYQSAKHEALFTARVTDTETDVCGIGYDNQDKLDSKIFSHAATKDLLKEYAQNF